MSCGAGTIGDRRPIRVSHRRRVRLLRAHRDRSPAVSAKECRGRADSAVGPSDRAAGTARGCLAKARRLLCESARCRVGCPRPGRSLVGRCRSPALGTADPGTASPPVRAAAAAPGIARLSCPLGTAAAGRTVRSVHRIVPPHRPRRPGQGPGAAVRIGAMSRGLPEVRTITSVVGSGRPPGSPDLEIAPRPVRLPPAHRSPAVSVEDWRGRADSRGRTPSRPF